MSILELTGAESCKECGEKAQAERDRLQAENDRLRESVKRLMTQRDERLARAEADNDRLRELVRDMFYAVHPADREKFLTNVAELGVEVDG